MEEKIKEVKEILQKYGQEHLLSNFNNLNDQKKEEILEQILQIDFEQIKKLYANIGTKVENDETKIEPISYVEKATLEDSEKIKYFEKGAKIIEEGKLAVVTMAGGQGTRLRT